MLKKGVKKAANNWPKSGQISGHIWRPKGDRAKRGKRGQIRGIFMAINMINPGSDVQFGRIMDLAPFRPPN